MRWGGSGGRDERRDWSERSEVEEVGKIGEEIFVVDMFLEARV